MGKNNLRKSGTSGSDQWGLDRIVLSEQLAIRGQDCIEPAQQFGQLCFVCADRGGGGCRSVGQVEGQIQGRQHRNAVARLDLACIADATHGLIHCLYGLALA